MNDPIKALIERGLDTFEPFPPESRYYGLPLLERAAADGRRILYVRRRFIPPASAYAPIGEHLVARGDRPDTIAAAHLGNPELFWRVCDANNVMGSDELIDTPGKRLRIALPAAGLVPGA